MVQSISARSGFSLRQRSPWTPRDVSARTSDVSKRTSNTSSTLRQNKPGAPQPNAPPAPPQKSVTTNPWMVNPAIDLLFCCGGLVWILFALHFFIAKPHGVGSLITMLALAAIAGTHALGETHIAATLARVYKTPQSILKFSTYTKWLALGCLLLAIAGLFVDGLTPLLAKIYLLLVAQHFTAQTYGLTLMYLYKGNYRIGSFHKHCLWLLMNSTAAFAILRQFTYKDWNPDGFLAQHIPFWGPLPEWVISASTAVLIASAVAFTGCCLWKLIIDKQIIPISAALMVLTGVLIFVMGKAMSGSLWLYVPAFYHGSQYVVLSVACHLKESGQSQAVGSREIGRLFFASPGMRYLGLLLALSIAIFIGVPRLLGELFGISYTLAFATVFVAVNLHHFATDGAIWKLRDPEVRKTLLA